MTVTVIHPGMLVKVTPDPVTPDDILEFGALLIEEHGHIKGDSGSVTDGFSIHGAIGEAATRATGSYDKGSPEPRALRDAAKAQLEHVHGRTEFEINDQSDSADEAANWMRGAIGQGQEAA